MDVKGEYMSKMRIAKRLLAVLLAAMLMMGALAPTALASFKAKVFTDAKVYNKASTSGKSVGVSKGVTVTVVATSGKWAKIRRNGHTGYIQIAYLDLVDRPTAYTAKSTPVYKQPSSSSSRMGTLSIGTKVYVVSKVNGYYRVQNRSGSVTGYIKSGYLTSKAKLTAAYNASRGGNSSASGGGQTSASDLLRSLLGKPYSASASIGSAPKAFNCSSLVRYVMGKRGISMKGTAAEQAKDSRYTKIKSTSNLKAGDVLCFDENSDGTCDHVAIYLGGSKFLEASASAGKVQINSLDSWYKEHFMWARRP